MVRLYRFRGLDHSSSGIAAPQISWFLPLDLLDIGRNGCAAMMPNGNFASLCRFRKIDQEVLTLPGSKVL
jgi:hypothetical protein